MRRFTALLLSLLCLACGGCGSPEDPVVSRTGFALNTAVSIDLYGSYDPAIAEDAIALCASYETVFSRTDPDSELCRLNAGELTEASPELAEVLTMALSYARLSNGAFDPTLGALSDLWQFTADHPQVPPDEAIDEALEGSGYERVALDGCRVSLPSGCHVDLGGIAKGYIAGRVRDFLAEQGVASAIINLGGNLYCLGTKPDGSPFRVGVQYPYRERDQVIAALEVSDVSVVTSGVYERYFEEDGVLYHHILDPATGCPVRNNLLSVTVISPSSVQADALSTACFVLGLEKGMALVDRIDDTYAIFLTEDFSLHCSAGLRETYAVTDLS